jgi:ActR/RegA family two-component response regulator
MPFYTQKFVLLVDDEEVVTKAFLRVFENQTYTLLDTAATVKLAIEKINFVVYDYIFLDMKIDGNNYAGMEILRLLNRLLIKTRSDGRPVMHSEVVIMSSSISLQDIMLEANALDVFHFLNKPTNFTQDYLLRVLQRLGLPLLPRESPR